MHSSAEGTCLVSKYFILMPIRNVYRSSAHTVSVIGEQIGWGIHGDIHTIALCNSIWHALQWIEDRFAALQLNRVCCPTPRSK